MSPQPLAERIGIAAGSKVWVIGDTVEETSLLDPLPEDVELIHSEDFIDHSSEDYGDQTWGAMFPDLPRERPRPHGIDNAVIIVTFAQEFHRELDDALPRMGSVSNAWVVFTPTTLPADIVAAGIADYGWSTAETFDLNDSWQALRIKP